MNVYQVETARWVNPKTKYICFGLQAIKDLDDVPLSDRVEIKDFTQQKFPEPEYLYIFADTNNVNYFKQCKKILDRK